MGLPPLPGNPETPKNSRLSFNTRPGNLEPQTSETSGTLEVDDTEDEDSMIVFGSWCYIIGTVVLNEIKEINTEVDDSNEMRFCIGFMIMYLCFNIKEKVITARLTSGSEFTPFIDAVD